MEQLVAQETPTPSFALNSKSIAPSNMTPLFYLIHRVSYKEYRLGFTICKEGAQYQIINNCLIGCLKLDRKQEAQDKQQYTSRSELKPFESLTARAAKTSIILGTMVPVTVNKLKGNQMLLL